MKKRTSHMKSFAALLLASTVMIGMAVYEEASAAPMGSENNKNASIDNMPEWPILTTDLSHIVCYGQSFSVGADAPGYPDPIVDGTYVLGAITGSKRGDELKPLQMTSGTQHPIVTAVNALSQMLTTSGIDTDIIAGSYGMGGKTIAQLMSAERQQQIKEEERYSYECLSAGRYTVFQNSVAAIADFAKETRQSVSCPAIVYLQGETDQNTDAQLGYPNNPSWASYAAGGDKEKYKTYMTRLKEDMQQEVMAAYGQTEKPLFVIYQVSGTYVRTQYSSINMAQIEFAQENADVILVQTPYFTPHYTNSHHLTVNGYRWLGEYIGRSLYTALVEREKPWPMQPESIEITGENTMRITVSGARNGLTIDTWTVEDASNSKNLYGFYLQADGENIVPTKVAIQGDSIELTLPKNLTADTVYLYYAGKNAGGTGNIRDNCTEVGTYAYLDDSNDTGTGNNQGVSHSAMDEDGNSIIGQKYPLYNWLASFCYEVDVPEPEKRQPANYHWEMQENGLVSVTDGNTAQNNLTLLQGSVDDGVLNRVMYSIEKGIVLEYDRPWVLEWRAAGGGNGYCGGKLLSVSGGSNSCAQYLYLPADSRGMVAWGVSSDCANYGFQLAKQGIDTRTEHTYRIENRVAEDGTNTVYLLVDGTEIGAMNVGYRTMTNSSGVAGSMIEEPNNWANGKDIYMNCIGGSGSFLLNNMRLSYLKVWEDGVIGNGVNDADAFREAVNGDDDIFLTGDIYLSSPVRVTGKTKLVIDGNGHTINFQNMVRAFEITNSANIVFRNIIFDGNSCTTQGVLFINCENIRIEKCTFKNMSTTSAADGDTWGLNFRDSKDMRVDTCSFVNIDGSGNSTKVANGIVVHGHRKPCENITISNCYFDTILPVNDACGINLNQTNFYDAPLHGVVENCLFIDCAKRAVKIMAQYVAVDHCTIKDVLSNDLHASMIDIMASNCKVTNNTIDVNRATYGISCQYVAPTSTITGFNDIIIENNDINVANEDSTTARDGLTIGLVDDTKKYTEVTVKNNVVKGNFRYAFKAMHIADSVIDGNTLEGEVRLGNRSLNDRPCNNNRIVNNTIKGTLEFSVAHSLLEHNQFVGNGGFGIYFATYTNGVPSNLRIVGNSFDNHSYGIRATQAMDNVIITKNIFTNIAVRDMQLFGRNYVVADNVLCKGVAGSFEAMSVSTESISMQCGDRLDVAGKMVVIFEGIIVLDGNYLTATDVGTATVRIDDTIYEIIVEEVKVTYLLGDVNLDGAVDSMDTNILFRYANEDATLGELSAEQLMAGDANQDGFVDSMDTNILFRYANEDATLTWTPVEILIVK